ncbi:MAG: ABC transporter substrate-binding protein [Phycisphaeraceae bacterium]|nr:ABC transporter substrate-binding protein [Phycisphaeraceae bacterium]
MPRPAIFFFILFIALPAAALAQALDPITLHLPAPAQFRFAGYYVAIDRGYFQEEGLQVSVRIGDESPTDAVTTGRADFGVLASGLVLARLEGKPVVALAAIMQESASCFVSPAASFITTPADLIGKRIPLFQDERDIELRALLRSAGVPLRDLSVLPPSDSPIDDLVERRIDALPATLTLEPIILRMRGVPVAVVRPQSYGVDFYGDALFTSEDQVRHHPRRVAAFRRAAIKGWRYALDNRDETIESLLRRHGAAANGFTRESLRAEAATVRDLILPDLVPIGQMNAERWERMATVLSGLGLAPSRSLDGFLFDPNSLNSRQSIIRALTLGLAGALAAIAIFMMWSLQLRRAVARATRQYRDSMRRLVEAQAIGHVGDWELDLATMQSQWSDEMFRLFERDPARGVPSFDDIMTQFTPEDRALIQAGMDRAMREGTQVRVDTRPVVPSGRPRHLSGIITPVKDDTGTVVRLIGVAQDITLSKMQEDHLIASEARYRTLIEHAPDAIVTLDLSTGRFIDVNPRACELYGLPRDVLLTKGPVDLSPPFQPDGRSSIESAIEKIDAAARGDVPTFRWDHVRADGSIVPCEIRLVRLPSESGPLVRGSITDISDRLKREDALRRRTAELERSNRELERFAYVASHDLQEPLRMVTSFTQLLARRYAGKLGPDADEYIAFAVDGAKRMQMLIDDLLAYSRAGRQGVKLTDVNTDKALDDALSNLRPAIESAGATISRDPLPTVTADATQFVQLFQNLISNAIKFRGSEPPRIHISARQDSSVWVFCVQDNGIGIDPAHTGKLFVMFQRLHPRHQYPGSGIGLALCKMIVERIGGRIWVESTPGLGSRFSFSIPITQDPPP